MKKIKIDSNVPIPYRDPSQKYPEIEKLKVGDSFFVAGEGAAKKLSNIKCNKQRRTTLPGEYCVRTVTEKGVLGARLWRID